jgi:hypothetical protein
MTPRDEIVTIEDLDAISDAVEAVAEPPQHSAHFLLAPIDSQLGLFSFQVGFHQSQQLAHGGPLPQSVEAIVKRALDLKLP